MKNHIVFDCDGTLVDTSSFKYRLFPGIKDLLIKLSETSELYVWTARDRASTVRILKELGIYPFFQSICTIDDAPPKPHTEGLKQLLGVIDKNRICMIGDSSSDIIGARSFGVKSIGAVWNQSSAGGVLEDVGADLIAYEPASCLPWILKNLL